MSDRHPDRRTLQRFLEDELTDEQDFALQRHVFTCPYCEQRLTALLPVLSGEEALSILSPRPLAADLEKERAEAAWLWLQLQPHSPERRQRLIWEDPAYQTWGLLELLIDRSRRVLPEEPQQAEDLVRLALNVAENLDALRYGEATVETAKVKAWTHLANTLRVLSDFRQAEAAFQIAELHFSRSWLDPVDEALILEFKAPIRRVQGRYEEALELLDDAIAIYREVNESHHQGRALLVKGLTLQYQGDPAAAAECYRQGLSLVDGTREPRLLPAGHCNLILCLNDSGRSAEAALLIAPARAALLAAGGRSDLQRLRWVEGRIAVSLGDPAKAERILLEVREAFIEDRLAFDAALVSLELATLYLGQHRLEETKRLATEMLQVFRSRDVHREALAALIVLQQAAEREQLTVGLVEEVTDFLKASRNDPHLRFRGPSLPYPSLPKGERG
jgi:tetratricopeptide (TPR) repeat protein